MSAARRRKPSSGALLLALALAWPAAAPWPARAASGTEDLAAIVEARIKALRRAGKIKADERTAWIVFDIRRNRTLASINQDEPFETASLIKPFLALAYFHEVKAGKLEYGSLEQREMQAMIQHSDNEAADWVMRRLGGPAAVQRLLKREYGTLLRQVRVVEYIPANGRTYRNLASAHDYERFLYALWTGALPYSAELRRLMNLPKRDRFGARALPPDSEVYDKTGSTSRLCGDVGILAVDGPDGRVYPYILVGLIEKERRAHPYEKWILSRGSVIRSVSELAYGMVARLHNLVGPDAQARR